MIRFLLMKDPAFASMTGNRGCLPLHIASVNFSLEAISILFDAYPEAVNAKDDDGETPLDWLQSRIAQDLQHPVHRQQHQRRSELVNFFDTQMLYAHQAQNANEVTIVDGIGYLPLLHHALWRNASLGAVKLLLKANPSATRVGDNLGALPTAPCLKYGSAEVVQLLANHDNGLLLHRCDDSMNFLIHHAVWEATVRWCNFFWDGAPRRPRNPTRTRNSPSFYCARPPTWIGSAQNQLKPSGSCCGPTRKLY